MKGVFWAVLLSLAVTLPGTVSGGEAAAASDDPLGSLDSFAGSWIWEGTIIGKVKSRKSFAGVPTRNAASMDVSFLTDNTTWRQAARWSICRLLVGVRSKRLSKGGDFGRLRVLRMKKSSIPRRLMAGRSRVKG